MTTETAKPLFSLVVPSYQMAPYVDLSLESFRHLRDDAGHGFEVIVSDDGSTDETPRIVEAARRWLPQVRYTHRERDARSCRSRARNRGVAASQGTYLVFLDAGVMARPGLLNALARAWQRADEEVAVISTLGLVARQAGTDFEGVRSRFKSLTPATLDRVTDSLAAEPAWCDRRQPFFAHTDGDLSRLPAPWLLAWTSALGVPRRLFDAVGGFDESFLTWGCEDCDFSLRMHAAGARFRAVTEEPALHIPHPAVPWEVRKAQHLVNARTMHAKRFGRESELFVVLQDPFAVNLLAMRLDAAALDRLLPSWDQRMLAVAEQVLRGATDALFVSAPAPELLGRFPRAAWAVPSRPLAERTATSAGVSGGRVRCAVGCALDEAAGGRDVVVLTDLIRLLPAPLQIAQLREAVRIGRKAYLLCSERKPETPDDTLVRLESEGWPWLPLNQMPGVAAQAGVVLDELTTPASPLRAFALAARPEDQVVPTC